jgi:hypothetical protein
VASHCIVTTSQISRVDTATGLHAPVVTGLYSRSVVGEGVTGADGVSAQGGRLVATMTSFPEELDGWSCSGQPADCATVLPAARAQAGALLSFTPGGAWKVDAGVGSSDLAWAAAHPGFSREAANANPYGVFAFPGGTFVTDAGANTLDFVKANGDVSVVSAFAPPAPGGFPADTVPTCVTVVGGHVYVGSLSGRLWTSDGFVPTEVPLEPGLLHHVTGCASDPQGDVFLVDMWGTPGPPVPAGPSSAAFTGSVVELARDGTSTVLARGLNFPNGIAVARDGTIYVTVNSTCSAQGSPFPYCGAGGGIVRLQR